MRSLHCHQTALDDLNARIVAADPADFRTIAHLAAGLEEIVAAMEPDTPPTTLLGLGLTGLRNIRHLEGQRVLSALAAALAVSVEHLDNPEPRSLAALDAAANGLLAVLEPVSSPPGHAASPGGDTRGSAEESPRLAEACPSPSSAADEPCDDTNAADGNQAALDCSQELLPDFLAEARDHLAASEAAILVLEANPDDAEAIHRVLRAFHTIKGAAGLLKFAPVQNLAHHAENLLVRCRDGEARMVGRQIDLALQSCDALAQLLDQLAALPPGGKLTAPESLESLLAALENAELSKPAAGAAAGPWRVGSGRYHLLRRERRGRPPRRRRPWPMAMRRSA